MGRIHYVTPAAPWESLAIQEGDRILFEGGHTYPPFRLVNARDVQVGSRGMAPAVIDGGAGNGVELLGCTDVLLSGLTVKGDGWRENKEGIGVLISGCARVSVCNVEALGFQQSGIEIADSRQIRIEGCYAHNNGFCGINTRITENQNEDIQIRYCKALDNGGSPAYKENHSGSGIGIFHTRNALVEFCEAAGNGWAQRQKNGNGPVGIWCACDVDTVVFRYCISRHNRTQPGGVDGDGFDIDGGVVNGRMEYDYSYENEGSGYLFCEYGSGLDYRDNRMEACISLWDATRVPYQGAVQYYGPDWMELENSVSRDCLLMPSAGKACVVNADLGDKCRNMALTHTVMIPSDRGALFQPENQVLRLEDNTVLEDEVLYRRLSAAIPRLTDPRLLPSLPVFAHLRDGTLAALLREGEWGALMGDAPAGGTIPGEKAFTYEIGGRDFAGSEYRGKAALVYDSVKPGFALELAPESDIRFEYTDWDSSRSHLAVLTARLTTPDVDAFFYVAENGRIVKAVPVGGTVSGYQPICLRFSGFAGVPCLGIMTGSGLGGVMLEKVDIYKLDPASDAPPESGASADGTACFGDVYAQGAELCLRGPGARVLGRRYLSAPAAVKLTVRTAGKGVISLKSGGRTAEKTVGPEEALVSLSLDGAAGPLAYSIRSLAETPEEELVAKGLEIQSI
ncbi:MAG TPA: right-handed parallel beta-helix repeat-containing protein [Firmicutes bacterium]|nr:right-handed parallel beta-helix repeat-containing protein [Bacillota bacterium]